MSVRPTAAAGAVLVGLLCAEFAFAEPARAAGAVACSLDGWSDDKDPAGLNVRSAPRKDAAVIAKIPPPRAQGGDTYAAEFRIIASQDGWLEIRDAKFVDYSGGADGKPLFKGAGWVFADKVRFLINSEDLRRAPDNQAPIIGRLQSDAGGADAAIIDHVHGCNGGFADITVHMPQKPAVRGWATSICSNQVTTCP